MTVPTSTYEAYNSIFQLFRAVWGVQKVDLPDVKIDSKTLSNGEPWSRFRVNYFEDGQRTLAGNDGKSRFGRSGEVVIELFFPLGRGVKAAYDVADTVRNAYEGKRTAKGVWFRDCRVI